MHLNILAYRLCNFLLVSALLSPCTTHLTWASSALQKDATITTRLAEWQALTAPQATSFPASRYAAFLRNPLQWPLSQRINWRYQNALAQEKDTETLKELCPSRPLTLLPAFLKCSPFIPKANDAARAFWIHNITTQDDETSFLQRYETILAASDQWKRYTRLERSGLRQAAQRQMAYLGKPDKTYAQTRFAVRFSQDNAKELFDTLSPEKQQDDQLLLWQLRTLRYKNRLDDAFSFWEKYEPRHAKPSREWAFERIALARALLRRNTENISPSDIESALHLTDSTGLPLTNSTQQEAILLNGYITLLYAHDPQTALKHFQPLLALPALPQRAEALYWSGECLAQLAHKAPQSSNSFMRQAAALPTTFYGQLALARLTHTPFLSDSTRSTDFLAALKKQLQALPVLPSGPLPRPDIIEAARQLADQGDSANATLFLSFLAGQTTHPAKLKALSDFAQTLQLPKISILASRNLAAQGKILYPDGYSFPYDKRLFPDTTLLSSLPKGLLQALVRQESSGDPNALSPAHAVGLTQILPNTALYIAKKHHLALPMPINSLTLTNPQTNLLLGGVYLQDLWNRFDGSLPLILAGYNAGPQRARRWTPLPLPQASLPTYKSQLEQQEDHLLNWLITLPYAETRNYIAQIETDMSLYALQ